MKLVSRPEYEEAIAASRDVRMKWWREARFGMFIHFGLYSVPGRHEWVRVYEGWPKEEYDGLQDRFKPKQGAAREWAQLARSAGMKYMVLTARHHDGFSLWDSKVNPYNSVNFGPKRDIVREYVDACREFDLKIGFYSSLMDWHHPDGGAAAYDSAARKRFNDYIYALNEELLTQYGKIDILWYDGACPMESHEGWNSLEMNQRLRNLQPGIIINDRSLLPEDYSTLEESLGGEHKTDWEACMTFNGICWGYVDSEQIRPYTANAQKILRMLNTCARNRGNLLLNIGPMPDGSVPAEMIKPLETVGRWLSVNGECVYGLMEDGAPWGSSAVNMSCAKNNRYYLWNMIWPDNGVMYVGGEFSAVKSIKLLATGAELAFLQEKHRIVIENLPRTSPDSIAGVAVIELAFTDKAEHKGLRMLPALNQGRCFD